MESYDVVIVGLGPTGGTLANLLALNDQSVLILEREKSIYNLPRAVHFDDEVMRVFESIGISKSLSRNIIINKGTKFVNAHNEVVLDWPRPRSITDNGWYPSYRFHQPNLERLLQKRLNDFKKVSIRRNTQVVKIINSDNHVEITIEDKETNKISSIKSSYVVGCDGAGSITREEMGYKLENLGFTQKWAVVDLILKKDKKELADRTIQYANSERPATYCRNVGKRRRWEFAILDHENETEILSDKYIWNFLKPWLLPHEAELERKTIYTFQSAIAKRWRTGRVFIVGDAAHLMPPFMGQGMCSGIRDASNLAWKINLCLKNNHNERLLDTYQSERFSNVEEYIQTTMRMGEFVNDIGASKITSNIAKGPDGTMSMKSIQPQLGSGLGESSDKNRGKVFPQLVMKNGNRLDLSFTGLPVLLLAEDLKDINVTSKIKCFYESQIPGLAEVLRNYKAKAVIVRPDRFVLETCSSINELNDFIKNKLNELNIL